MTQTLTFTVQGMTCAHCTAAVEEEVLRVPGVNRVDVDLKTKQVVARGTDLDELAVRAAVVLAGYEPV